MKWYNGEQHIYSLFKDIVISSSYFSKSVTDNLLSMNVCLVAEITVYLNGQWYTLIYT